MKKKHARQLAKARKDMDRGVQAANVLSLLDELVTEIQGLHGYVKMLSSVLAVQFPDHIRLKNYTDAIYRRHEFYLHMLYKFQRDYKRIYDDYKHTMGEPEIDRTLMLEPYMISINELLDRFPMDQIVEDFLDE